MTRKSLLIMMALLLVVGLSLMVSVDKAMAQVKVEICDNKVDDDGDGLVDLDDPDCQEPPPKGVICHNIGGPRDLGANCDMTGNCSFTTLEGITIEVTPNHFLGIIISFNQDSAGALAAHIAHGDGFVISTFDPPLHLASTGQIHQASNVECLAERIVPQPDEPGN
jgi:hypothetical protein